ncbi:MAG: glycosyltransferase family 2 protein [Candidatus Omnitrophota bacterium]
MKFSIIIPVYNEEKILEIVLDELKKVLSQKGHDPEIIVVDDASRDKTYDIAKSTGVKVLRHEKNYGYGAALKTGIKAASNDVIAIIDGDGSYPANALPALLEEMTDHDMVIGARIKKGVKMSFLRKIPKFILKQLAQYLVNEKIPDINSGMRIFKKSLFEKYANILPDTFSFTLTITLAAISSREKIKFIPIDYHKRHGRSKIRPLHDTLNFFMLIIRTIIFFNPLKVFLPLAIILIFAAAVITFYSYFVLGKFMDVTVTLLTIFGIQIIVLGLITDLINRKLK